MAKPAVPNIAQAEVQKRTTKKSCYVTVDQRVYDVTSFLSDHPGGEEYILEYGGKDVKAIMADELSHSHSDAAYEILDEYFIGIMPTQPLIKAATDSSEPGEILPLPSTAEGIKELEANGGPKYAATGMSNEEDLSKETDIATDYKEHKFLDLNKPLFMQVWRGGFSKQFYLEQVHRPRHYKGGESAPLFGNFLEPLSKTPWWVVPSVWLPCVSYGVYTGYQGLGSWTTTATYWFFGLCLWTIIEYTLHRALFHIDHYLPDNRWGITAHFLLHGIHHYLPMDKYRLVMPPTLFVVLATPFWYIAHGIIFWNWYGAVAGYAGGIFGYICYDCTHYFLHHRNLPPYYRELKKYHLQHHFADYENGFGVTSRFWDRVFGTELKAPKVMKTS